MRSSIFAAFGLGVLALSSAALAAPTGFFAQISIETYDESFNTIEYREVLDEDFLEPGESKIILPYDEKVASPVLVTIDAVTVGNQRTVTITYEALESYFVTPYAFEDMSMSDEVSNYGIYFARYIFDDEWDGGTTQNRSTLLSDGQVVFDSGFIGSQYLSIHFHGYADYISPAEPGFFAAPGIVNGFEQTIVYNIVPAPGAAASMLLFGCAALRRRR